MRGAVLVVAWLVACEAPEEIPERDVDVMPDVSRVRVEPDPIDFGFVPVGQSDELKVKLYNDTDAPLELRDVTLTPAGEAVRISLDFHDDIARGLTIRPGDSYRFVLHFEPTAVDVFEGDLELVLPAQARKFVEVIGQATPL
jgi:hypothetical protein